MNKNNHTRNGWASILANDIYKMSKRSLSRNALDSSKACILDFFAVVIAALKYPEIGEIHSSIKFPRNSNESTLLNDGEYTTIPLATFSNATQAHVLDFDDTIWTYIGHSTAVILPPALALSESIECSGKDLLNAFALGVEAAHRIGSPITPELSENGWQPTPVIGIFGSTVASSLIMKANIQQLSAAITLSTNMTSGIRQNFGSKGKSLAAGWAAQSGLLAATFAQNYISGSQDALEGKQGFYMSHANMIPDEFGEEWNEELAIESPGVCFKLYPCCTGSHPSIDAMIMINKEYSLSLDEISYIEIETSPEVLNELIYPFPINGLQAKFSLPYCAATALLFGKVELEHFEDNIVNNPKIHALMKQINVKPNSHLVKTGGENCPAARIKIITKENVEINKTISSARGNPPNQISITELQNKFRQCASTTGMKQGKIERLIEQIMDIDKITDIRSWIKKEIQPIFKELHKTNRTST